MSNFVSKCSYACILCIVHTEKGQELRMGCVCVEVCGVSVCVKVCGVSVCFEVCGGVSVCRV